MRKDRVRRLGALAIAVACCAMTALPAYGAEPPEKDEVIYVNLTPEGDSGTIYVVNSYDLTGETAIVDYGDYREVRNLTTTAPLEREGDAVKVTAPAGKLSSTSSAVCATVCTLPRVEPTVIAFAAATTRMPTRAAKAATRSTRTVNDGRRALSRDTEHLLSGNKDKEGSL